MNISQKQNLIDHMKSQGLILPFSENLAAYREPLTLYGKTISNRIGIQPLEGFDSTTGGAPTDLVRRRYLRFVRGGSALIWFEACAVSDDGKSNPYQMALTDDNVTEFRSLLQLMDDTSRELNQAPTFKVLQLTHSGRVSKASDWNPMPLGARLNAHEEDLLANTHYSSHASDLNTGLNKSFPHIASDERIRLMIKEHIHAAELAADAGFDAVDIKVCHGYFLSELLSAYNRPGPYGGSFANRTRAVFEIVDGIKAAVGDRIGITMRLNAFDSTPAPYGYGVTIDGDDCASIGDGHTTNHAASGTGRLIPDLTETIKICEMLRERGVELIDISASSPATHLFGPDPEDKALEKYVSSADLLMAVRILREAVPGIKFMCTGLSAFKDLGAEIGAGGLRDGWFDIAGFGRQALAYPEFARDILDGNSLDSQRCCTCCGNCFKLMDGHTHTGCIVRDQEIYLPLYRRHVLNQ